MLRKRERAETEFFPSGGEGVRLGERGLEKGRCRVAPRVVAIRLFGSRAWSEENAKEDDMLGAKTCS